MAAPEQSSSPFHWYIVVPWCLTAFFGIVSTVLWTLNYRRTHFPAVQIKNIRLFGSNSSWKRRPDPKVTVEELEHYIAFDLRSIGADMYETAIVLELDYGDGRIHPLQFEPQGVLPDPMKKGQAISFWLPRSSLLATKPRLQPLNLPARNVRIAVYGSGRTLIRTITSVQFRDILEKWDRANKVIVSGSPDGYTSTVNIIDRPYQE